MADNNPIQSSDLFHDDGAILEAIKQFKELRAVTVAALNEITKEAKEMIEALKSVNNTQREGQETTKKAATDAERLAAAQRKYVTVLSETDKEILRLKNASKQANTEARLTERINNSLEGSYNRLSAQYSLNKIRLNAMSAAERDNTAAGKALVTQTKKIYEEMDRLQRETGKATLGVGWYERAQTNLKGTLLSLTSTYIGLAAAQKGSQAIYDKTKELNSTDNSLKAVITDQGELADTYGMLAKLADDYGVDVLRLTKTYVGFRAAAKETNIPLSQQQAIYQSIVKSGAVLGRSTEETEGALLAVTQMMSKGNVQAEELRGQLGERLPGAFNIMAKSMGISTETLNDMLKEGQVLASDVLPKFATELEKSFGADQVDRVETLAASEGRLANSTTELVKAFNASDALIAFNNGLAAAAGFIADNLSAIMNLGKAIVIAGAAYATWTISMWLSNTAMAAWTVTTSGATIATKLKEAATWQAMLAEEAFSKALKKNPIGLILTVIVAAAAAYLLFATNASNAEKAQNNINDAQKEAIKNTAAEKSELSKYLMIAKDDKLKKEQRLEAIKKLNAISPEYLGNITLETINTTAAAKAVDGYVKSLNRKALAQALDAKRTELQAELSDKELKQLNEYRSGVEKSTDAIVAGIYKAFGVDTRGEIIRNAEELDAYVKKLGLTGEAASGFKSAYAPLLKAKNDDVAATKEQIKVLDDYYKKQIETGNVEVDPITGKAPKAVKEKKAKAVKEPDYWAEHEAVLEAMEEGQDKELESLRIATDKKYVIWNKLGIDTTQLTEHYEAERQKIIDKYTQEAIDAEKAQKEARTKAAKEGYDALIDVEDEKRDLAISEVNAMKATEEEKTKLRIKAEIDRLKAILKINDQYGQTLSDNEIAIIKNNIKAMEDEMANGKKGSKGEKKDLYDMLGIKLDDDQKEGLNESLTFAKDQLQAFLDKRVELADQAVEAAKRETDASEERYNKEIEARNNGYANNVITAAKELEQKKKQEAAAQKEREKALRAQQAIDTAMQISGLITASVNIWKSLSSIPIVGTALAVAAVGLMWGSYAANKAKAKQAGKEKYGDGGFEFLDGGSHASGNDIAIGTTTSGKQRTAEGGETLAIIKKSSTRKYKNVIPSIINSLNKGTFENTYGNAFLSNSEMPNYVFSSNFDSPELKKIGEDLSDIKKRGERKRYTDSNGNMIEEYRNITRRIKG